MHVRGTEQANAANLYARLGSYIWAGRRYLRFLLIVGVAAGIVLALASSQKRDARVFLDNNPDKAIIASTDTGVSSVPKKMQTSESCVTSGPALNSPPPATYKGPVAVVEKQAPAACQVAVVSMDGLRLKTIVTR